MTARHAPPLPFPRRSALVRLVALLVALLVVAIQPRSMALSAPLGSTVPHLTKHTQRVESNALRVDFAVRVAPAPSLASVPFASGLHAVTRRLSARLAVVAVGRCQLTQPVTHFHSKRRIPRMNSDEPPRA